MERGALTRHEARQIDVNIRLLEASGQAIVFASVVHITLIVQHSY